MYQITPEAFEVTLWYVINHVLKAQQNPFRDLGWNRQANKQTSKQAYIHAYNSLYIVIDVYEHLDIIHFIKQDIGRFSKLFTNCESLKKTSTII